MIFVMALVPLLRRSSVVGSSVRFARGDIAVG